MTGRVAHIAINADDDGATQVFYQSLFDWQFEPYYPGFVRTPVPVSDEFVAAVQQRREIVEGVRTKGPEVTVEVDDLDAVLARVDGLGGRVVMDRSTIPGVGVLAFLLDPSGNYLGVIEYAPR
jgi:predicted enzyme related to lactoylglutathione lyase